ncbi:uncharacterized protein PHACADRAFT_262094 [Phanerochaete carnosa HHB-10118-sp]|uniref:Uncharacterized protein n=1 Tax=Phanerochaete carnosa (strain HHB-10118-sp) TaxID=650164 RepID=K5VK64_PHACS|nr:uncharacterized protein PHACADRAFT_262094 [Phanerochaete carnosa HHB-10118-sp]EKM51763.1 hypothetical protein PHACADRAFT_262094 [Phanerochaete carnosa HHB-10118-sp]
MSRKAFAAVGSLGHTRMPPRFDAVCSRIAIATCSAILCADCIFHATCDLLRINFSTSVCSYHVLCRPLIDSLTHGLLKFV